MKICNKCVSYNIGIIFGSADVEQNLIQLEMLSGISLLESGLCSSRKHFSNDNIEEIMKCLSDADVPHVLLSCCTVKPDERVKVLEEALFSGKNSEYNSATNTMFHFNEYRIKVPKGILNKILDAFSTANSIYGGDNAGFLEYLIRKRLLSKADCNRVAFWMKKYERLTRIKTKDFEDEAWGKKLESRKRLAVLAHTLKLFYENQNIADPEGVVCWEKVVKNNEEFVEIRRAWE